MYCMQTLTNAKEQVIRWPRVHRVTFSLNRNKTHDYHGCNVLMPAMKTTWNVVRYFPWNRIPKTQFQVPLVSCRSEPIHGPTRWWGQAGWRSKRTLWGVLFVWGIFALSYFVWQFRSYNRSKNIAVLCSMNKTSHKPPLSSYLSCKQPKYSPIIWEEQLQETSC